MKSVKRQILSAVLAVAMLIAAIGGEADFSVSVSADAASAKSTLQTFKDSAAITACVNDLHTYGSKGATNFNKALSYAENVLSKTSEVSEDEYTTAYLMLKSAASPANLYKKSAAELTAYLNSHKALYDTGNKFNSDGDITYTEESWFIFGNAYREIELNTQTDTAVLTNLYDALDAAFKGLVKKTVVTQAQYTTLLQKCENLSIIDPGDPNKRHRNTFTDERRPADFDKEHDHIRGDCKSSARWGVAWLSYREKYEIFSTDINSQFFSMVNNSTTSDTIVNCYEDMKRIVEYIEGFTPDQRGTATVTNFKNTMLEYHNRLVDAENFLANLSWANSEKNTKENAFAQKPSGPLAVMDSAISAFYNNVAWNNVATGTYKTAFEAARTGVTFGSLSRTEADRIIEQITAIKDDTNFAPEAIETGGTTLASGLSVLYTAIAGYTTARTTLLNNLGEIENQFAHLRINRREGLGALGKLYSQIETEINANNPTAGFQWVVRHSNGSSITDSPNMDFYIVYDRVTGAYLRAALTTSEANRDTTSEELEHFTRASVPDLRPYVELRLSGSNAKAYQIMLPTTAITAGTYGYFTAQNGNGTDAWYRTFNEVLLMYRAALQISNAAETDRDDMVHDFWWSVTSNGFNETGDFYDLPRSAAGTWAFTYRAFIYALEDFEFAGEESLKTFNEVKALVDIAQGYYTMQPPTPPYFADWMSDMNAARIAANNMLSNTFTQGEVADKVDERAYQSVYTPLDTAIKAFEAEWARWPVSVREAYELILRGYRTNDNSKIALAEDLAYKLISAESDNIWRSTGVMGAGNDVIFNGRLCNIPGKEEHPPYVAYILLNEALGGGTRSLGDITGSNGVDIFDALEVLKFLVNMDGDIKSGGVVNQNALSAALITPASKASGEPTIFDALEILKKLVNMDNYIDNPPVS